MQFPFLHNGKLRLRELKWHSKVIRWVSGSRRVSCMTCARKTHSRGHFLFFSFWFLYLFHVYIHSWLPSFFLGYPAAVFSLEPYFSFNYFSGCLPSPWDSEGKGVQLRAGATAGEAGGAEHHASRQPTGSDSTAGAFVFMARRELWDASHPLEARVLFHALFKVILKTTLKNEAPKGL